jgi:nucleotide-binding universal stress UspA family protein
MYRKMLVADDGSPGGEKALKSALELAKRLEINLTMICVEELPRFPASIGEVVEAQLDAKGVFEKVVASAQALARSHGVAFDAHIVAGDPVRRVVEFAKSGGYDLLVVGFMGHAALYNRLVGSATLRLVEQAPCKVLVVK